MCATSSRYSSGESTPLPSGFSGWGLADAQARAAAIAALARELDPMDSREYPAAYKRRLSGVLVERALVTISDARHAD